MKMDVRLYICWLLFLFGGSGNLLAQGGNGGGIYAEDGGRIIGTLVVGNRAVEGFGISGGQVTVINCTVVANEHAKNLREVVKPGDIYCADGTIVDTSAYRLRTEKDAVGVVFWCNSDPFAAFPKGYVVALEEAELDCQGVSLTEGETDPVFDAEAYPNTERLANAGIETAVYCRDYRAGTFDKAWALPAGYQLAALFGVLPRIEASLTSLEESGMTVTHFKNEAYWSSTETVDDNIWMLDFDLTGEEGGGFLVGNREGMHRVRPVFAY